jgi:hypothetical protein
MASWACSNCWMELLMGEPSAFSLPFHPPLPLLVVPIGPDQLVSIVDPSTVGCTLSSAGGRSSSLFPVSFLGLPLLHGVHSCGGARPPAYLFQAYFSPPQLPLEAPTPSLSKILYLLSKLQGHWKPIRKSPRHVGARTWHSGYLANPIPCSKGIP